MRITADGDTLFRQSKYTAEEYLSHACTHLDTCDFKDLKFQDYMRFAELSAYDLRTSITAQSIQMVSESLDKISESLDRISESLEKEE